MPLKGWLAVGKRTWSETSNDNVGLVAAGVAFYGFLAIVPLLAATVLVYGLVADPPTVVHQMSQLASVMPADVAKLIGDQLMNVVSSSDGRKGFGLLLALAIAMFGARNGAGAVITALNIAYEEQETRSFIRVTLLAIAMTAVAVLLAILAAVAIAAMSSLKNLVSGAPDIVILLGRIGAYALMTLAGAAATATLYRYGPDRDEAEWVWLTPGSLFAAAMWLLLTIGFGVYVANFGNYNATYGSLGAVVVTLTWLYLSSYILLFGAELNSELEHQTARDTTGSGAPLGKRGAWVADHVAGDAAADDAPAVDDANAAGRAPLAGDFAAGRAAARVGAIVGLPKIGWKSSAAATVGLSLLKRGHAKRGASMLLAAAATAWMTRERQTGGVKAVLFDVDGTLVDSNEDHVSAWDQAFRDRGFTLDRDAIRGQIGKGGDLLVPALLPDTSDDVRQQLTERHGEVFKQRYLTGVLSLPGAGALIRRVHDEGQRVVLASSADAAEVDHYARQLGVDDIVDARTTIDDARTSKPAGDIFAAALDKVGVDASEAIVVGDSPYDMEAAARCGIRAVAVRSGGFDDARLRSAGAIAIYDDVADVLRRYDASPLAR